jgi:DNA-binding MarR family transcriptional regulator
MNNSTFIMLQAVWELDEGLQRLSRTMLAAVGVTGPQRLVLRLIEQRPDASANEISKIMHLNRSTISGIVRRLEAEGFLRREQHTADGRVQRLVLTERGHEIARRREGTIEAAVEALVTQSRPKQLEVAVGVMRQLAVELERQRSIHREDIESGLSKHTVSSH